MKAADHLKRLKKRRTQIYSTDRDLLDSVIYLMERLQAEELDVEAQILRNQEVPDVNS